MDNLGAVVGPLIALGLIAVVPLRVAIGLSVIPGLLAALAIVYAIRHTPRPTIRERTRLRFVVRPLLRGRLGRLLGAVSAFELGNIAATLLILRATQELTPSRGVEGATSIALVLYVGYNLAATVISTPAGRLSDRLGVVGPVRVMAGGVTLFAFAYLALIPSVTPGRCCCRGSWPPAPGSAASRPPSTPQSPPLPRSTSAGRRSGCWPSSRAWGTWPPAAWPGCYGPSSPRPRRSPMRPH
jgi:hypothetical protein